MAGIKGRAEDGRAFLGLAASDPFRRFERSCFNVGPDRSRGRADQAASEPVSLAGDAIIRRALASASMAARTVRAAAAVSCLH